LVDETGIFIYLTAFSARSFTEKKRDMREKKSRVHKFAELALHGHAFCFRIFHTADDLAIDAERFRNVHNLWSDFLRDVEFQAVPHIEHLVHFLPVGAALLVDDAEQRWYVKQIVLNNMEFVDEVQHFGLRAATAMHHAMDLRAELTKYGDH